MPTPPLLHSAAAGIHPAAYLEPAGPAAPRDGHLRVDPTTTPYQLQVYVAADATWHAVGLVTPVPPGGGGAATLLYSTTLGAAAASIVTPALGTGASHLWVVARLRGSQAVVDLHVTLGFNGDAAANYARQQQSEFGATVGGQLLVNQTSIDLGSMPGGTAAAGDVGDLDILIPGYAGTTWRKGVRARLGLPEGGSSGHYDQAGWWLSTAAISTLTLLPGAGNFVAGSAVWVYGLA